MGLGAPLRGTARWWHGAAAHGLQRELLSVSLWSCFRQRFPCNVRSVKVKIQLRPTKAQKGGKCKFIFSIYCRVQTREPRCQACSVLWLCWAVLFPCLPHRCGLPQNAALQLWPPAANSARSILTWCCPWGCASVLPPIRMVSLVRCLICPPRANIELPLNAPHKTEDFQRASELSFAQKESAVELLDFFETFSEWGRLYGLPTNFLSKECGLLA